MNKRLIIIFSVLAVLVLILVLFCAVFVVSKINVVNTSSDLVYSESEIIESSKIKVGLSIFSLSESKVIENIEKAFPLIKVDSVSRYFPNTVEIKISKRVEVFALEYNGVYLALDKELKVLNTFTDLTKTDDVVLLKNFIIEDTTKKASELISHKLPDSTGGVLGYIVSSAEKFNFIEKGFAGFFESITFNSDGYIDLKTRQGITFLFQNIQDEISIYNQFASCYSVFQNNLNDSQKKFGYLIWQGSDKGWVHELERNVVNK